MQRAFGANLRTVVVEAELSDYWGSILDMYYPDMRTFLEEVARVEAARPPAPTSGSQPRE